MKRNNLIFWEASRGFLFVFFPRQFQPSPIASWTFGMGHNFPSPPLALEISGGGAGGTNQKEQNEKMDEQRRLGSLPRVVDGLPNIAARRP